jgi:predicted transcriptional regulator YdeE
MASAITIRAVLVPMSIAAWRVVLLALLRITELHSLSGNVMYNREVRGSILLIGKRRTFIHATRHEIPALWDEVLPLLREAHSDDHFETYGVCLESQTEGAFDYLVCRPNVEGMVYDSRELEEINVPAATYAVCTHRGHVKDLPAFIHHAWSEGVARAGWKVDASGIGMEYYPVDWSPETGPTQVLIPVA